MIFAPDLLSDKVAVITGGGTGIGRAIGVELARAGAALVLAGRRAEKLEAAAAELRVMGVPVITVPTNVREPEQAAALMEQAVDRMGHIDILVNSAGGQFPMEALKLTPGGWKAVIDLNLNGTFYASQAAARRMVARGGGCIINIVANFLERGCTGAAHSAAARAGVVNMARSMALEWAQYQITVNNIAPGHFVTEGMKEEIAHGLGDPHFTEKMIAVTPLRRAGRLEELGWMAVYLASAAGSYITGQTLYVDGGNALGAGVHFLPF